MPETQHFILTRFGLRDPRAAYSRREWVRGIDALDPLRLAFRLELFRIVCFPSVVAQTCQDFDWVILVDPDLPSVFLRQLEDVIVSRHRTYIHTHEHDIRRTSWLRKYLAPESRLI